MAAVMINVGPQSPLNRNLERLLEEAQLSGELRISSRRLREFPKVASKYNLNDTVYGDLSKNKLSELPAEVTRFSALEKLNLYHNVVRFIPDTVVYLQCLTYLDLSRNQLSVLPAHLCKLPLQVLLVSHNRLVSLPEEINQLTELVELDASSNQLSHLPIQLGDLQHLEALNLRKNFLVELPRELMFLKLVTLDISLNRISTLPVELRFMISLVELCVEHNPLTSPPAHLCTRGRIHIFKHLEMEAIKEDRKRGILEGGGDLQRGSTRATGLLPRKCSSAFPDVRMAAANDPRRSKRFTTIPAVDNNNTCHNPADGGGSSPLISSQIGNNDVADAPSPRWGPQGPQPPTSPRHHHTNGHTVPLPAENGRPASYANSTVQPSPPPPPPPKISPMEDEEDEDEVGNEERRRAARKILEHQMASQEEQRLMPGHVQTYREYKEALRQQRSGPNNVYNKMVGANGSNNNSHTPSPDTPPSGGPVMAPATAVDFLAGRQQPPTMYSNSNKGSHAPSPDIPVHGPVAPAANDFSRPLTLNLSQEIDPTRPSSVKAAQKEAVLSYVKAKTSPSYSVPPPQPLAGRPPPAAELLSPTMSHRPVAEPGITPPSYRPPPSNDSAQHQQIVGPNSMGRKLPITPSTTPVSRPVQRQNSQNNGQRHHQTTPPSGLPPHHTAAAASFTVRRELERQREEMEQIQQLRQCIESRLKVSLPEDLSSALTDGVVLCHLVNHIRPRSVLSIHVPSPAVPKLTVAKCRRNVENFIDACRRIGVPEDRLCNSADVLERRNVVRVAWTVSALVAYQRPSHPHHLHHRPSAGV